jgi:hypothetical protein
MDAEEQKAAFEKITQLATESSEISKLQSARLRESGQIAEAAREKFVEASRAFSSLRLIRYFQLRREGRRLLTQAHELSRVPEDVLNRSAAALSSAKDLERKIQQ